MIWPVLCIAHGHEQKSDMSTLSIRRGCKKRKNPWKTTLEMWHFLHVKKTNSGSGKPCPEKQAGSLTGNVGTEMLPLSKD